MKKRGGGQTSFLSAQGFWRFVKAFVKINVFSSLLKSNGFTVARVYRQHCKYSRRFAFTLAEVLITLGIIGIVAAMTLPMLIADYQKKQTVVNLKSAYSVLNQALALSENENGSKEHWDYSLSGEEFYKTYLQKHLKVVKEYFNENYFEGITYKCLKGACSQGGYVYKTAPKFVLANGTVITITNHIDTKYFLFYVDINGKKNPNTRGKDLFLFTLSPQKGIIGFGIDVNADSENYIGTYTRETLMSSSKNASCNKHSTGNWCSTLIIYDGWEIKDDYPW